MVLERTHLIYQAFYHSDFSSLSLCVQKLFDLSAGIFAFPIHHHERLTKPRLHGIWEIWKEVTGVGPCDVVLKATSHSMIFDIPMRPLREDQKHRHRFTR